MEHLLSLACLEGAPAPEALASDLLGLAQLSDEARARLGAVLGHVLPDPVGPGAEAQLTAFAEQHGAEPMLLGRALRAVRFLVRAAARANVDAGAFASDLRALSASGGASEAQSDQIVSALGPQFEPAKAMVLREAAARSLAVSGKVLHGVDWRVDQVVSSSQAKTLSTSVVWLTLHVEEHGQRQSLSFQATPPMLEALRAACESALR